MSDTDKPTTMEEQTEAPELPHQEAEAGEAEANATTERSEPVLDEAAARDDDDDASCEKKSKDEPVEGKDDEIVGACYADTGLPKRFFVREKFNPGFKAPSYLSTPAEVKKILPPTSVKTLGQRLGELTPEERAKLDEFKAIAKEKEWYGQHDIDDWCLCRYLVARQFDVKKATEMLAKSFEWRRDFLPKNAVCVKCNDSPTAHMQHFVGWDLQHRPVTYCSYKWAASRWNPEESVQHNIETLQQNIRLMPEGVEQAVFLTDFQGYSHWKDGSSAVGKAVIDVFQNQFPERLACFYLVDPPTTFWVLWKMLSIALDAKTRAKVMFVYTEAKPSIEEEFPKVFPKHVCDYLIETYKANKVLPTPKTDSK